jgi:inhibitor of cysteine peptidase
MKKIIILNLIAIVALSACSLVTPTKKSVNNQPAKNTEVPKPKDLNNSKTPSTIIEKLNAQKNIKKFANISDLAEYLEENELSQSYPTYGMGLSRNAVMDDMVFEEAMPTDALKSAELTTGTVSQDGGGSDDYSETNVQVAGVDEADIVKNDGKYIYIISRNNLFIVDAYPAEGAQVLSKIEFKDRPQEMYIKNDKLVIFGRESSPVFKNTSRFIRRSSYVFFKVFDIGDRLNPRQIRDLQFEGNYKNSRMIGDYVYLVTENYNYSYYENEPVLPRILEGDIAFANGECVKCVQPDIYYFDIPYERYNFTSINSINISDSKGTQPQAEHYLMSNSQNLYVSQNNIYITYTKYISEYELEMELMKELLFARLSAKDQEKISKIEAVDNFILNQDEKRNKIQSIIERYISSLNDEEQAVLEKELEEAMKAKYKNIAEELEKTVIHKVAIKNGDLEYLVNGQVTGQVLNQFSMDEDGDYFRIATTKNRTWSRYLDNQEERESYSNLFILDKDLKIVGSIKELAKGEKIYSVRFMQNRAYMVTFKQMDPLFVIDLSSPTEPKVLGELKIPGYSDYLHPYDENTLIGIGKDTTVNEWGGVRTGGLKISLFDVSDVKNPEEVDNFTIGESGSDSLALHDHKAVLFSKDKNLLAIPVRIREGNGDYYSRLSFNGAAVFDISKDKIALKGKIGHIEPSAEESKIQYYYENPVKRSLYISENLYTVSDDYLKINNIESLKEEKSLLLLKEEEQDYKVVN